jgi:hypothetical protein
VEDAAAIALLRIQADQCRRLALEASNPAVRDQARDIATRCDLLAEMIGANAVDRLPYPEPVTAIGARRPRQRPSRSRPYD